MNRRRAIRTLALTAFASCLLAAGALAAETGVIAGDVVNARTGPGTSYDRVEMLAGGKQVAILGEEGGWYKIKWNDSVGYVLKSYVAVSGGSSSAQSSSPNATVTGGDTINVRSGPGTEYSRVTMVAEGKRVRVVSKDGGWCKVSFDGTTGYILADYVKADGSGTKSGSQSAAQSGSPATVTGGEIINVRSGPGTDHERVTTVADGKKVTVIGEENGWSKVSFDGMTGYILSDYVSRESGGSSQTAKPAAEQAVDYSVGNATVKGGDTINVRTGPGTDYSRVTMVGKNKRVTLLTEEGGWFKVSFDGTTGYILGDFLKPDDGALAALTAAEAGDEEPEEASVPLITEEDSAVLADAGGRSGFIVGGTINVRTGPGTENERVAMLSTGKRIVILGEENGWAQISYGKGTGYVHGDYVYEGDELPESANGVGAQIAQMAQQYLGTRYVYGGAAPGGFDCSGLTLYLYKQFGYSLPHSASGQYANCGYKVSKSELQPGDLVFFASSGSGGRINHVAVYIGDGQIVHARYSVGKVHLNSLSENYYSKYYVGAIRIA